MCVQLLKTIHIHRDNSVAIAAGAMLTLSLSSDLYYKLGIDGTDVNPLLRKREFNLDLKKVADSFLPYAAIVERLKTQEPSNPRDNFTSEYFPRCIWSIWPIVLMFQVKIDLTSGSKRYNRLIECATRCNLQYDILLHWIPPSEDISPFSPVKFLIDRIDGLEWKKCTCR